MAQELLGPLIVFLVPAIAGTALLLLGNHRRVRREGGVRALFAAGVALLAVAATAAAWVQVDRNTLRFTYTATLTPNGSGTVRVFLPAPVDPALTANLAASPQRASAVVNRTGSEPAIEVTLTETTTVTASFSAYGYTGAPDLGGSASWETCSLQQNLCTARIAVLVVSGNVTQVQVSLEAVWSGYCYEPDFMLHADALPGEGRYPASFVVAVC